MWQSTTAPPQPGPGDWAAALAAHEGLVRWVVRHQWRGALAFEDAVHAGRIGLWQALRRYDPTRGTRVSTYAVPAIQRAVWAAVAADPPRPRLPAGSPPRDTAPEPIEAVHQAQVQAAVHALVGQLPVRARQVLVAHYGLGAAPPQSFAAQPAFALGKKAIPPLAPFKRSGFTSTPSLRSLSRGWRPPSARFARAAVLPSSPFTVLRTASSNAFSASAAEERRPVRATVPRLSTRRNRPSIGSPSRFPRRSANWPGIPARDRRGCEARCVPLLQHGRQSCNEWP